jgi:hypothetical protein
VISKITKALTLSSAGFMMLEYKLYIVLKVTYYDFRPIANNQN